MQDRHSGHLACLDFLIVDDRHSPEAEQAGATFEEGTGFGSSYLERESGSDVCEENN